MSDAQLTQQILEILRSRGDPAQLSHILHALGRGVVKRDVNRCLYKLQGRRMVSKIQDSPPTWALGSGRGAGSHSGYTPRGRGYTSRGRGVARGQLTARARRASSSPKNSSPSPGGLASRSDIQSTLLNVFLQKSVPLTVPDLHRASNANPSDILSVLNNMEREGVVSQKSDTNGSVLYELVSKEDSTPSHTHTGPMGNDLEQKILKCLQESPSPLKAINIASRVSSTRQDVNPILYRLKDSNKVSMTGGSGAPQWGLTTRLNSPTLRPMGRGKSVYSQILGPTPGSGAKVRQQEVNVLTDNLQSVTLSQSGDALPQHPLLSMSQTPPSEAGSSSSQEMETNRPLPPTEKGSITNLTMINDLNRNSISVLNELCQSNNLRLEWAEVRTFGPPHAPTFVIAAIFGEYYFEAQANNKKEAKKLAAELALQKIRANASSMALQPNTTEGDGSTGTSLEFNGTSFKLPDDGNIDMHEFIASIAHSMHPRLEEQARIPQPGRKVIACFVMEDTPKKTFEIISFGSGTRCIAGDKMTQKGDAVNDSHAEVVARRGLVRFLYRELKKYYKDRSSTELFEFVAASHGASLRLKDTYKLHLYISTAPCGDGAQFSRDDNDNREPPADGAHKPTMTGKSQGVLRTKMEGGEGTIPIADETQPQTWDGILQGGRLRTMSCSDKIARWNILGLQGSLLSLYLQPIYMASLTLGSLHHHGHLSRAVCCRFKDLSPLLPPPFFVNHPKLGRVKGGDEMKRHTEKTSNHCMNWSLGNARPEVTNGSLGRPISGTNSATTPNPPPSGATPNPPPSDATPPNFSCVCKAAMFAEYLSLAQLSPPPNHSPNATYQEAKSLAISFTQAKQALYQYCQDRGFGMWMCKPLEQNQFSSKDLNDLGIGDDYSDMPPLTEDEDMDM